MQIRLSCKKSLSNTSILIQKVGSTLPMYPFQASPSLTPGEPESWVHPTQSPLLPDSLGSSNPPFDNFERFKDMNRHLLKVSAPNFIITTYSVRTLRRWQDDRFPLHHKENYFYGESTL